MFDCVDREGVRDELDQGSPVGKTINLIRVDTEYMLYQQFFRAGRCPIIDISKIESYSLWPPLACWT